MTKYSECGRCNLKKKSGSNAIQPNGTTENDDQKCENCARHARDDDQAIKHIELHTCEPYNVNALRNPIHLA